MSSNTAIEKTSEDQSIKQPLANRDISWLSFNYRVLQEAKDNRNPLLERIKFLAIYSNNLDEFFRVRVAHYRNLEQVGKKTRKKLEIDPREVLKRINETVNEQQEEYTYIFRDLIQPALAKNNIYLKKLGQLSEDQLAFIENYFHNNLLPYVQPVLLVKQVRPFLRNASLYLTLDMRVKGKDGKATDQVAYGLVQLPSDRLPRFVELPNSEGEFHVMFLDDIVRYNVRFLFPGYIIKREYSIKITRDAELYIDDEFSGDLLSKIKKSLNKRSVGPASRMVYDRNMPAELLKYLMEMFEIAKLDLYPEGRYHNNFDLFKFPSFGKKHLQDAPLPGIPYTKLGQGNSLFENIKAQNHLLLYPFHSYSPVVDFFESASHDPNVTDIKIVQYRVANDSKIMHSIMNSSRRGKSVLAFIEVKARFDEQSNIDWGERLENAGVDVHYSFPGLKVHAKIALITRKEEDGVKKYAYLSTGNFHEGTAKIYSDFGYFTSDQHITEEIERVFYFLETVRIPTEPFEHLLVGQFNLRSELERMIDQEIENAKNGIPARINLKLNSIEDKDMISRLYTASQAGVKIRMVVRGICSLIPGVPGLSENIEIISIVDRFLEHARIYWFENNGQNKIYLSSADFMSRNLNRRIEVAFPIVDEDLIKQIKDIFNLQWDDNTKARIIDDGMKNIYKQHNEGQNIRSQLDTYFYLRDLSPVE